MQRSLFSHLKGEAALAARILYKIAELVGFSGRISKRELERKMNAWKHPDWPEAWQILTQRGCIEISRGNNRQEFIRLIRMPEDLSARWIATKPRRRRPQTPWFKERLPEFLRRDGYDDRADEIEEAEVEDYGLLQYAEGDPLAR